MRFCKRLTRKVNPPAGCFGLPEIELRVGAGRRFGINISVVIFQNGLKHLPVFGRVTAAGYRESTSSTRRMPYFTAGYFSFWKSLPIPNP